MRFLNYLLTGFALLFFTNIQAQDTIYTRSGNEILAKAIEKNNNQIVFTHFDDELSKRSRIKTNKVDSIVYKNGKVEKFEYKQTLIITQVKNLIFR